MNSEGYTYLIYDKFTLNDHSFPNKNAQISLKDIMSIQNLDFFEDDVAIKKFNKENINNEIKEYIEYTLYKIYFFVISNIIPINVLCVGINHKELTKYIELKQTIPNKNFLENSVI